MKIAVLIPSHIYYDDQLERLDNCLESLISQTLLADIFVSISFENDIYKRKFSSLLRKYSTVKFKLSAEQKFQMEHLSILSQFVKEYDMIMFCDDDDSYIPFRVENFKNAFEDTKRHCNEHGLQFGGVREVESIEKADEPPEYWAYGIPPSLLLEFFRRIEGNEDLMRHKFADMYLRNYLKQTGGERMIFATFVPEDTTGLTMYQYTKDNPNSICAQHVHQIKTNHNVNSMIRDQIILALICQDDRRLTQQLKNACISKKKLQEVVPHVERIKHLANILCN